jgi:glutaconyl-CoA/methylmalonyl-CoA decarboxylase subunit gamma
MRLELEVEGRTYLLEVNLGRNTVEIGGVEYPVRVVSDSGTRAELEISGEKVVLEGWPAGSEEPPGPISANGEVVAFTKLLRTHSARGEGSRTPPEESSVRKEGAEPQASAPGVAEGPGVPLRPPMPGKVLEVRVREGDRVAPGQILLVLEAMKMRNEVTAPVGGHVAGLAVEPGASVRARDVLLRILPG